MTLAPAAGPPSGTSSPPPIAFSVAAPGSAKSRIGEDEDESIGPARSGGVCAAGWTSPFHVRCGGCARDVPHVSLTDTTPSTPGRITGAGTGEGTLPPPAPPAPPLRTP